VTHSTMNNKVKTVKSVIYHLCEWPYTYFRLNCLLSNTNQYFIYKSHSSKINN